MSSSTRGKYEVAEEKVDEEPKGRCSFLYDSSAGTLLGRTGKSWLLITLFYLVYYGCLAGFFTGMLSVFLFGVIQDEKPHLTGDQSLLKLNPGLGFRPQPEPESSLISFTAGRNDTYSVYVQNLQDLYNKYQAQVDNERESCDANSTGQDPTKVCRFNWDIQLPNCVPANRFGYANGEPCVILKMNRIFGWLPDPIDQSVPHPGVRCFGDNAADNENLGQPDYQPALTNDTNSPAGYFNNVYFPYLKQKDYKAPLVAVVFKNIPKNTLVMVQCRLVNLRNSVYDRPDREAMVRFELFVRQ